MNYLLNFEEEDDYQEESSGGRRRNKLLTNIRKRMSIVKKNRNGDDEEEEDDDDYSAEDGNEQYGFLKRQMMRRQQQKEQQQQQQKQSQKKGGGKEEKPRRKSMIPLRGGRGMLSRGGSSRELGRMSILQKKGSRADKSDNDAEEEEVDDVAMPLPGHASEDTPNLEALLVKKKDDKTNGKSSSGKKQGKERRSSGSQGGGSKGSGTSRDRQKKRPRRTKSHASSDRSVDSPPSVASTESSSDPLTHKGAAAQHHAPRMSQGPRPGPGFSRLGTMTGGKTGLANKEVDEMGFVELEKMSLDYYYQGLPWIIKTWIYFVTVVVPFTFLYYCFCGIFHSTALHDNKLLQKVCFANVLFGGLGCTFKTGFWANQTLDSRGILSSYKRNTMVSQYPTAPLSPKSNSNRDSVVRRLPDRTRTKSRDGSGWSKQISSLPKSAANGLLRSPTLLYKPRTRPNSGSPGDGVLPQLTGDQNNINNNNLRSHSVGDKTLSPSAARASITAALGRPLAASAPSIAAPLSPGRKGGARRTAGGARVRPSNQVRTASSTSVGSKVGATSVWDDVEKMIPTKKKSAPTKARPSMDKHLSIMEIMELHEMEEHNNLLR